MTGMTTWHEERRQDQLTRAQIERERDAARAQLRLTDRQASAKLQQAERQARTSARQQARKARAARRAARTAWLRAHTVDLLFVPVIAVPAVLAWTAMAAYGSQIYGPLGVALPAFSEGAMWAFAAATTITRRRHPDRPLWHLRAGTVLFAAVGAALNFAHAVTRVHGGPLPEGPVTGVVYAVVSVAGVTVHQMVTAGPRRSHAERHQARAARASRRRESAARRAALRDAVAALDAQGNATLVFEPGMAELARRWGRTRLMLLTPAGPRLASSGPSCPWPAAAPVLTPAPVPEAVPRPVPAAVPRSVPERTRARTPGRTPEASRSRTRKRAQVRSGPASFESAEAHFRDDLAEGRVPPIRRVKAELHVGQDRAEQIRDHLESVAPTPLRRAK